MVSLKTLRTIVGISGLTLVAFVGGTFFEKDLHRKQEYNLQLSLANSQVEEQKAKNAQEAIYLDYFSRVMTVYATDTIKYAELHKMIRSGKYDFALECLEDYLLEEIEGTEDFLVSLQNGRWSSNVVANSDGKFQERRTFVRDYLHDYWKERGSKAIYKQAE